MENYVIRQVFVLVREIFLVFGGIFLPRLLGASLNYAFLGGRDGLFWAGWGLFFSYADSDRGKPRLPWHGYGRGTDWCGFFNFFGFWEKARIDGAFASIDTGLILDFAARYFAERDVFV